jgi:hypothetical protein
VGGRGGGGASPPTQSFPPLELPMGEVQRLDGGGRDRVPRGDALGSLDRLRKSPFSPLWGHPPPHLAGGGGTCHCCFAPPLPFGGTGGGGKAAVAGNSSSNSIR